MELEECLQHHSHITQPSIALPGTTTPIGISAVTNREKISRAEMQEKILRDEVDEKAEDVDFPNIEQVSNKKPRTGNDSKHSVAPSPSCQKNLQKLIHFEGRDHLSGSSRIYYRSVMVTLRWQFQLAMWLTPGLSETIISVMEAFKESSKARQAMSQTQSYDSQKIILAIEKIRTNLVMGFLGALRLIHSGNRDLLARKVLIEDGWIFLQHFLNDQLLKLQEEVIFLTPKTRGRIHIKHNDTFDILSHTIQLPERSPVAIEIIIELINTWYQVTEHQASLSQINLSYDSFLQKCEEAYQQQGEGKSLWRPWIRATSNGSTHQGYSLEQGVNNEITGYDEIDSAKTFPRRIEQIGNLIIEQKYTEFAEKINVFFKSISKEIHKLYAHQSLEEQKSKEIPSHNIVLSNEMIDKAVLSAQKDITPSFFGIIFLMQKTIIDDKLSKMIFENGWEHLKTYFNQWLIFFIDNKNKAIWTTKESKSKGSEWASTKKTIAHLSKLVSGRCRSTHLIWYLVEVWYEAIISTVESEKHQLSTHILPPDHQLIKKRCHIRFQLARMT
ncbi:uncharacterized protein MELLADRAFT_68472 [Melampsora larici-populina 98AG31]|uniref:Uncharacterized protein n=1 Tax=Melampsora larici-populina (strain 98AG31 / pathotype 3-4-7) TaxID=747676 RepID=F4S6X9_MELLP|nr:uncharacterized protein MELLADRAFT_68472 [Melampsora larici-populina 98AG31]EGF99600.1 hypothetical protein MELLADRAFT_68472 [Melampsora larici-populina 98AG31]